MYTVYIYMIYDFATETEVFQGSLYMSEAGVYPKTESNRWQ